MNHIYLSLGSNLGDRQAHLQRALQELESAKVHILRVSKIYETEPYGYRAQAWFLNLVAEVETTQLPFHLLNTIHRIERKLKRHRIFTQNGSLHHRYRHRVLPQCHYRHANAPNPPPALQRTSLRSFQFLYLILLANRIAHPAYIPVRSSVFQRMCNPAGIVKTSADRYDRSLCPQEHQWTAGVR